MASDSTVGHHEMICQMDIRQKLVDGLAVIRTMVRFCDDGDKWRYFTPSRAQNSSVPKKKTLDEKAVSNNNNQSPAIAFTNDEDPGTTRSRQPASTPTKTSKNFQKQQSKKK
jgi:hypothetical protein